MRPVDLQQALRGGDCRFWLHLLAQQRLRHIPGPVAKPFALCGEPRVEGRIDAVQVLQQIAVQQRQRSWLVGCRAHDLFHINPDHARPKRDVVPGDDQHLGACRCQAFQKAMDLLPQRGPSLLLGSTAPQQFSEPAAQGGTGG